MVRSLFPIGIWRKTNFYYTRFWEIAGIGQLHDIIETRGKNEAVKFLDFCYLHIKFYMLLEYQYEMMFFKLCEKKGSNRPYRKWYYNNLDILDSPEMTTYILCIIQKQLNKNNSLVTTEIERFIFNWPYPKQKLNAYFTKSNIS